ncbi:hypothetical protein DLJ49_12655 [Rhodovulum sp. 12E13]|uniref:hypothetical protein n=1 Tax=Rhodovulum sp. 12E13 TaxID=2203891 RepID=UPI000E195098|nr:hypothetical protein [Rhodovulum sp. 12E13]RDC71938.1 hypothetical protein DLJ49_12655 [Rhodovulum sp. 12E13]
MTRHLITASVLALGLAAAPASAQYLENWEFDENPEIDRAEYEAWWQDEGDFDAYDADADEGLGRSEFYVATYDMMDLNGDGMLTVAEWDTWADTRIGEDEVNLDLSEWDQDGDDRITRAEYDEAAGEAPWFTDYDANTDDLIDAAEYRNGVFEWIDANDDGVITESEVDLQV